MLGLLTGFMCRDLFLFLLARTKLNILNCADQDLGPLSACGGVLETLCNRTPG